MTRSFGLDAASALKALKTASERFQNDDLNEDLAREYALKAWHLCDHVFHALGSTSRFATLGDLQEHVRNTCPDLAYLQDICTESKHANIWVYPGFPTLFWGLSVFFVGDLMGKALWK